MTTSSTRSTVKIPLGWKADGTPVSLPAAEFARGGQFVGRSGSGKTTVLNRLATELARRKMPVVMFDPAVTGSEHFQRFAALYGSVLGRMAGNLHLPPLWRETFHRRFAFGFLGSGRENPISINILRRFKLPGRMESTEEVVTRNMKPFEMLFHDDIDKRVKVVAVGIPLLTILIASDCYITDYYPLLMDPAFLAYCEERIHASGILADPHDGDYVRYRLREFKEETVALRLGKDGTTIYPFPERYNTRIDSTRHAFQIYRPGSISARFFEDETFPLEAAVFGSTSFTLTTNITDDLLRKQAFTTVWAQVEALIKLRTADTVRRKGLTIIHDEIEHLSPTIRSLLAITRNLDTKVFIANQQDTQWEDRNMGAFAKTLPSLLALQVRFRPGVETEARSMAFMEDTIDPFALMERFTTQTKTSTDSWSRSFANTWGGGSSEGFSMPDLTDIPMEEQWRYPAGSSGNDSRSWADNDSTGSSGSSSDAEVEHLIRIAYDEQFNMRIADLLKMPEHTALVSSPTFPATRVAMMPMRQLPTTLAGVPYFSLYRASHDAYWSSRRRTRASIYDPTIWVSSPAPKASAAPPKPTSVRGHSGVSAAAPAPTTTSATPTVVSIPAPVIDQAPPKAASEDRRVSLLNLLATLRVPAMQEIIALTSWSYDKVYRELDEAFKAGDLERIRPFAPRGQGSAPIIYVLTVKGARTLAEQGGCDLDDLQRIAKNAAVLRRAIEANRTTQWQHRRWTTTLFTLLVASTRTLDPAATVTKVTFDRELFLPVDLSALNSVIPARDRTLISPDPTKNDLTYVPDAAFTLNWTQDGKRRSERVFLEVQTGFGERDERDLAIGKAWKMRALFGASGHEAVPDMPRIVVWSRTSALEQRFFEGARSVFGDTKSPLWLTNGDIVPLTIASGTQKKDIPDAVRVLVGSVQQKVWRWLRFPKPDDRRRFVGVTPERER